MPAIELPIDGGSVVTAVIGIGLVVVLLWAGPAIGFRLAKALIRQLSAVVGAGGGGDEDWEEQEREWDEYERDHMSDEMAGWQGPLEKR